MKQTLPPGSKEVAVTERLPLEMLTAIYNKQRYPEALINGVMKRIRAEQKYHMKSGNHKRLLYKKWAMSQGGAWSGSE